jgi:cytochrome c oxidase assembly factor CtaG
MTTRDVLFSMWDFEPSVVIGCAALLIGYFAIARERLSGRSVWFFSGVLLLLVDLVSPIDTLGDTYLFSAHVLQHFLLALIVPILLLKGTPPRFAQQLLGRPVIRGIERRIGRPPVSWLLGVGTMLVWHVPVLFNAALGNEQIHIFQHLSFLVTGTIFWWPVLGPLEERRLTALGAISYLFSACTACSMLGAVLTFSPPGAYPAYLNPGDPFGALALVRGSWGLDPKSDQQLGGMLMWVPGCLVYLSAILASVARWYGAPDPGPAEEPCK